MDARSLLLCLLAICAAVGQRLALGDDCALDGGGVGTCKRLKNCPHAVELAANGRMPQVCDHDRDKPVICCPQTRPTPGTTPRTTPATTPRTTPTLMTPKEAYASDFVWLSSECGDTCALDNGGVGSCKALKNCPLAVQLMAQGVRPQLCFYDRGRPVVCCPRTPMPSPTPTPTPTPTPIPSLPQMTTPSASSTAIKDGISWQKCQEYAEEFDETLGVQLPALLFETDGNDELECAQLDEPMHVGDLRCRPKEYPHMAALGYGNSSKINWLCGGSLISERYVLTAASCLHAKDSGRVRWVRLGDVNMASNSDRSLPRTIEVANSIAHPDYAPPSFYHDIALLRLKARVAFDAFVRPACLHTEPETSAGDAVVAIGWGVVQHRGDELSESLMKAHLRFVSAARCNTKYAPVIASSDMLVDGILEESMVCAGDPDNVRDVCMKDSGSPLQVSLASPLCMTSVVGVASFSSRACRETDVPGVFTRVSHYVPWIETVVWPEL